jgi:hypothetical protein
MTQALYAHMNNKRKKKRKSREQGGEITQTMYAHVNK